MPRWAARSRKSVYALDQMNRDEALADARTLAVKRAVAAGAQPDTVEVVEVEEIPLTYVPSNATRIRIKAVGNLGFGG